MKSVLTIGTDLTLLEARRLVLSRKYTAVSGLPGQALDLLRQEHFDLLLVCYSSPQEEASIVIQEAHSEFPHLCIVRLLSVASQWIDHPTAHRLIVVDSRGPEIWLSAVDELLNPGTCAPFSETSLGS